MSNEWGDDFFFKKMFTRGFWDALCPYDFMVEFLTLRYTYPLKRREVCLRYGEDIMKRFETFETEEEREEYCEHRQVLNMTQIPITLLDADDMKDYLVNKAPATLAIGPVFPCRNRRDVERKAHTLIKYAPIVLDVDIDDFLKHDIKRSCACPPKQICDRCYGEILRPATLQLREFLQTQGFRCILFIFSGRRGFNCYIMDKRVWGWSRDQRDGLVRRIPQNIHLDRGVTIDPTHLCKPPLVPHQATGLIACPIMDLQLFKPSEDTVKFDHVSKKQIDAWVYYLRGRLDWALE